MTAQIHQIERGVVYVATGETCRKEALRSARSFKQHNPSTLVAIFSDLEGLDPVFDYQFKLEKPKFSTLDKVQNLWRTPFQKTLYLDSDTFIAGNLDGMFTLLSRVDFAGTHEVARGFWYEELNSEVPAPFCEINGGVLAFRSTPEVIGLLRKWYDTYLETSRWLPNYGQSKWMLTNDQPSLRLLLFRHPEVKLWVLPTEYNALRINGTYLWGMAKIIHGRDNIEAVAERMNKHNALERSFFQGFGVLADFDRIHLRDTLETVVRVNICALRSLLKRVQRTLIKRS